VKIGDKNYDNLCLVVFSPLLIDGLSILIAKKEFIGYWVKIFLTGRYYEGALVNILGPSLYGVLSILFYVFFFILCRREEPIFPSINLDKIPNDDKEWIEEIKVRKQRGDKMAAYSSKGEAAARRKAKALGLEDCFVEFLSEEEVKKQRGWK